MFRDVEFIEKGIVMVLETIDTKDFVVYAYMFLKKNPRLIKKIYVICKTLIEVIEREHRDKIS